MHPLNPGQITWGRSATALCDIGAGCALAHRVARGAVADVEGGVPMDLQLEPGLELLDPTRARQVVGDVAGTRRGAE